MSQRPETSHPEPSAENDGRNITLPPVNVRPQDESAQAPLPSGSSRAVPASASNEQYAHEAPPPLPPMQSPEARPAPSTSRSLGVHNILNPTEPENARPGRSFSATASPAIETARPAQGDSSAVSRPPPRAKQGLQSPPASVVGGMPEQSRPRKTLIPKSPRSMSLGGGGTGVFLQSTKQQPGAAPSPAYTAIPGTFAGSAIPPLPSLPQQPQYAYNTLPPVSVPPMDRRRSASTAMPSGPPQSQIAGPQTSYFDYHPQQPPVQQDPRSQGPYTPSHYQPMQSQSIGGLRSSQPAVKQEEGPYMNPMHGSLSMQRPQSLSAGHPMQLPGGRISVPLDRVSGSRSADEKRKHNAAASSRFRERRKKLNDELKKENETYAKEAKELKQALDETRQRLEMAERDLHYWRDAFHSRNPAGAAVMQQPPAGPPAYPPQQAYGHPSARIGPRPSDEEERPARRRRTQGPEQGQSYTLPPTTTYSSTPMYPARSDDGRPPLGPAPGLHPPRSAPGSMSAPSGIARSPFEQYPPSTNGSSSGYFHGQHSGPPTPGSAQPAFSPQPPSSGPERR